MSTRSFIALEDEETGQLRGVYCHSDGYPEHTGKLLVEHYRERAKVEALIALGDLSYLQPEIAPPDGSPHRFDYEKRSPGVTVAYHRDRGDELSISEWNDADDYYAAMVESWTEWAYLYRQGVWFVTKVGGGAGAGLCNADDPEGTAPANWRNVEGVLTFVEPERPAYAFDPRQMPRLNGATLPVIVAQLPLI